MSLTVNIPNGVYPANISDYGIKEAKSGKLYVYIDLQVSIGGAFQRLRWFGGTSAVNNPGRSKSPRDWTMKAFTDLCSLFTWNNLLEKAKSDVDKHGLVGMEVSVSITNEMNPIKNQLEPKAKYINPINNKFKSLSPKALSILGEEDDMPF
jgi:hypothetical protein